MTDRARPAIGAYAEADADDPQIARRVYRAQSGRVSVIRTSGLTKHYGEARGVLDLDLEVRRRDGVIPAVDGPRRLTEDGEIADRIPGLVPQVPTPVWDVTTSRFERCGTRTRSSRG